MPTGTDINKYAYVNVYIRVNGSMRVYVYIYMCVLVYVSPSGLKYDIIRVWSKLWRSRLGSPAVGSQ